jgi:hypothetical protein
MRIRAIAGALAGATAAAGLMAVTATPAHANGSTKPICVGKAYEMYACFTPKGDKFCITNKSKIKGNYVDIEWFAPYKGKGGRVVNKKGYNKTVCKSYASYLKEGERVNFHAWLYNKGGVAIDVSKDKSATI